MTHAVATHIEIRPNRDGHDRAFIQGTRVRVQDVAMMSEAQGETADQIVAALPHLTLAQVHAALSYYFDHRSAIQNDLKEDEEFVELIRQSRIQSVLDRRLKPASGQQDSVRSS